MNEKLVIDRIKAYAFPVLMGVLAWFLIRTINTIDSVNNKMHDIQESLHQIKEKQAEAKGLMQGDINRLNQAQIGIERRLDRIEEKISKW
jgi:hypothetical protein